MIRPFTCICMLLAAGSGLYLYQTKHRAQLLDREIGRTIKQTEQARDRIGALKGEWALLSEPDRLNELAGQHLALKTLAPTQFVAMADLGARLPAPLPPGTMMRPVDEPAPSVTMAVAKPIAASPRVADKAPERPADKPVQMAALPQPAVPPPPRTVAKPPAPPAATPVTVPGPVPARLAPQLQSAPPSAPPIQLTPRIMAPVMNVSAAQHSTPAPGSIGESVARTTRVRAEAPVVMSAASSAGPYAAPAATAQSGNAQSGNAAGGNAAGGNAAGGNAAGGSAVGGSALGGAGRLALPAPVPFNGGQR